MDVRIWLLDDVFLWMNELYCCYPAIDRFVGLVVDRTASWLSIFCYGYGFALIRLSVTMVFVLFLGRFDFDFCLCLDGIRWVAVSLWDG